ncbi:hypothetical protein PRELSG_9900900 [Plasmodium relictum]|uniref:Plasmodium RESA N-terminal domain-containing protein n=1 Tax=Plasmodium relictum TaxID=85471 RepID=A0A1J1GKL1_PLARL|nr:hypothetical protein PRELSG_9900900 [Plasmodium relictum]CRG85639.1 hypothetical protein PRELSG_9900900 [Plasmodium relictum]
MENFRIIYLFYCLLIINSLIPHLSLGNDVSLDIPNDIKNYLYDSHFYNLTKNLEYNEFKYFMMVYLMNIYGWSSYVKQKMLLYNKNKMRSIIYEEAKKENLDLSDNQIDDIIRISRINIDMLRKERSDKHEVNDLYCLGRMFDFQTYKGEKLKEIINDMKHFWNISELIRDKDLEWKNKKWDLWESSLKDKVKILDKKDSMLNYVLFHKKATKEICHTVYEYLKKSWVETYRAPFMSEFHDFIYKSLEEFKENKDTNDKNKEEVNEIN